MTIDQDDVEHHSRVEPWIIERVCVPVLGILPRSVAPNALSLANHAVCWLVFALSAWSVTAPWGVRSAILILAAGGVFVSMLLDCLDGMQARRTGRASKLGELVDHGLDTINVPLLGLSLGLALQVEGWPLVVVAVTIVLVYHAQLLLQHESGRFVHASTSGVEAQLGVVGGFLALSLVLLFAPAEARWIRAGVFAAVTLAVLTNIRLLYFYGRRLGRLSLSQVFSALILTGFGVLHLWDAIGVLAFLMLSVLCSLRLSGGYVLRTILQRPWNGIDATVMLSLLLTAAASQRGFALAQLRDETLAAFIGASLLSTSVVIEIARNLRSLRPNLEPDTGRLA